MLPDALKRVDANVQAIKQIERASALPPLPDEVTADLSMLEGANPQALSGLFAGIQFDLDEQQKRAALPVRDIEIWAPQTEGLDVTQRTVRGLTSVLSQDSYPFQLDGRAVQRWKQRAVDQGYLDLSPAQVNDGRWLPEYRGVAAEMANDQMQARFSGEEPGSISLEQVAELAEEWLSPRGLYRAALELDLFWDFEQIGDEFKNWGNKLDTWQKDPWDVRKLLDMITGPVDDILFPAINIALMFTGVGEIWLTGRALAGGAKAASLGSNMVAGLYRGRVGGAIGRTLIAEDRVADIARLGKALPGTDAVASRGLLQSQLYSKVGPDEVGGAIEKFRGTGFADKSRRAIEAWRGNSATIMAKKTNQQVLRAGFASNLQAMVDDSRGHSIGSMTTVDDYVNQVMDNDLVDWSVDLLLTPTTYFQPGSIVGLGKELAAPVRNWARVTDNEKMVAAFHEPVRQFLLDDAGEEAVRRFDGIAKERGVTEALADALADGNRETLGGIMGFVTLHGGVDALAVEVSTGGQGLGRIVRPSARAQYNRVRRKLLAQLSAYDTADLDRVFDQLVRYQGEDAITDVVRGTAVVEGTLFEGLRTMPTSSRRNMQRQYLSDVSGVDALDEDHVLLFGRRDVDSGEIDWTVGVDEVDDDTLFTAVHVGEYAQRRGIEDLDEARRALEAGEADDVFLNRYRRTRSDGSAGHWRWGERADFQVYDQTKLENLREVVNAHNDKRQGLLKTLMKRVDDRVLSTYVAEVVPTFGRSKDYFSAMEDLGSAQLAGDLANARFAGPMSETGRRIGLQPTKHDPSVSEEITKTALPNPDPEVRKAFLAADGWWSPFARELESETTGKFALRYVGTDPDVLPPGVTPSKQDAVEAAHVAARAVAQLDNWQKLVRKMGEIDAVTALDEAVRAGVRNEQLAEQMAEAIAEGLNDTDAKALRQLVNYMKQHGLEPDDIERRLTQRIADLERGGVTVGGRRWDWSEFGVQPDYAADAGTSLRTLIREVRKESEYLASRVTNLPEYVEEGLRRRGYEVVYGVDFSSPDELRGVFPELDDVFKRHIRKVRMNEFFSRKTPAHMQAVKGRAVRSHLHAALQRAARAGDDINLRVGDDVAARNGDMDRVMSDLWEIADDWERAAVEGADDATTGLEKVAHRLRYSRMASGIDQLPSSMGRKRWIKAMSARGYTQAEANVIQQALQESRALGFQEMGLMQIEYALRGQPNLINGLRLLGRHSASTPLGTAGTKAMGTAGAFGGAYLAHEDYQSRAEEYNPFAAAGIAIGGAAVGKMAGSFGAKKLLGAEASGVGKFAGMADKWEGSKWYDYAFLADNLAVLRDQMRFTLSPIFDASRYSEAIILSQLEEVPDGLRNLRAVQSPKLYRRHLARQYVNQGASPEKAAEQAAAQWEKRVAQFRQAARGDFDFEVIDGMARRYESVGILGFSPSAWQASTYAQLLDAGLDEKKAYDMVRQIYTYGTTGRSSAELSVNFVFFPFSFTKKTLGHLSRFIAKDMTRGVILHDMLATYQRLDEAYDLEQEFADRLPILNRAARVNLLAYGIGPGRFGGINAQMLDALGQVPGLRSVTNPNLGVEEVTGMDPTIDGIANLFIPQGISLSSSDQADNVWDITRKMLPAINDVSYLLSDVMEQTGAMGGTWMTDRAEERRGWEEWRAWQDEQMLTLSRSGITWQQAMGNPQFAALAEENRVEISAKYPAWKFSFGDGIAAQQALDLEVEERLAAVRSGESTDPADFALAEFTASYRRWEGLLRENGYSFSTPENVPPFVFDRLRQEAIRLANTADSPYARRRWVRLYGRLYRRLLGDIALELT